MIWSEGMHDFEILGSYTDLKLIYNNNRTKGLGSERNLLIHLINFLIQVHGLEKKLLGSRASVTIALDLPLDMVWNQSLELVVSGFLLMFVVSKLPCQNKCYSR